ncbi:MAG: DEAD/DEAH box helicase [Nitrososphaerota archaeon]
MLGDIEGLLSRPVVEAVREKFEELTDAQKIAIPHILRGENVLLMTPTGTGKTEAALLPILSMLTINRDLRPITTLYITPLRALNRDLLDRIDWWCQRLDITVAVRHGDTPERERRTQSLSPPQILIITPEALQSLLIGKIMRKYLANVKWVIVDEVHELATDKRGVQLAIALQRLRKITKHDFQIIGISATVGSAEEVGKFLVGPNADCKVLIIPIPRETIITVLFPISTEQDRELADYLGVAPEVAARLRVIKELVESHSSTLIFTNTRPLAEILANRFKAWMETFPVSIHHGSLSRDKRLHVERELKYGQLHGLICTSSLEMGIDIGRVDLCIQYNSPREVTRIIQRVGRSGHKIGGTAKGVIIVIDSDDALEAMVISKRAKAGKLEPTIILKNSLDVLQHQIAGLLLEYGRLMIDEIMELVRKTYNYRELTVNELQEVLSFMVSIGLARLDQSGTVSRPINQKRLFDYYFNNLSMIPEERQYLVVDAENGSPIGILDESFVAEYGDVGTKFILAGKAWIITSMSGQRIYVAPATDGEGAVPSWVGDEIPVPLEVAMEVGEIRRRYCEMLEQGVDKNDAISILASEYEVPIDVMARGLKEIDAHLKLGIPVPSDRQVLIEKAGDFLIIHLCGGLKINRTIGRILSVYLAEKIGAPITVVSDPYRIVLKSKHIDHIMVLEALKQHFTEDQVKHAIETSNIFKRRLIHVARKMGVVEKEASLLDVNIQQIILSLRGTAPYKEALHFTLVSDYDWDGAKKILKLIDDGNITVSTFISGKPTPLASLTIDRYLYEFEIFTPERLHKVIINAVRGRLFSERVQLICTSCYSYIETVEIGELDAWPECKNCNSRRLGVLKSENYHLQSLINKKGKATSFEEKRLSRDLEKTADLVERYGKPAIVVLAGREITPKMAEEILTKEPNISPRLIELIIEAEKKRLLELFK